MAIGPVDVCCVTELVKHSVDCSKDSVSDVAQWKRVMARELPKFVVADSLFSDPQHLPLIISCFGVLRHAVFSSDGEVTITSAKDLRRLEWILRSVARDAMSHVSKGDRAARLFVGNFRLTADGHTAKFLIGSTELPASHACPPGEVELNFNFNGTEALIKAQYNVIEEGLHDVEAARDRSFISNIESFSSDVMLSYHGAHFSVDGVARQMKSGLYHRVGSDAEEVLCFVTMIDETSIP
eukprot:TRINITY_DN8811_c0_g1_i1.p1 TRINITY_DN8811_c0_g1~~TRINITY_DN8811_c0_g1_i1.p1  ORF type:complete len:260 (+),score=35.99 TRINITY_DN8811_c0_g1_i1:64-780(+)